ncbi:MAG: methyl-accepting chemotaxis protein [Pseudomonas sp.]|uniref:methyl-accepting chemotaxis protein n=1 Tax=Pseudomonas sp. TaxID=306 RepID=UPI0030F2F726
MRNLSVRLKLYVLTACFISSLTLVGGAGWFGIRNAGGAMEDVSNSLVAVDALASLRHARLASVAAMQEGASWRPEAFDGYDDKSDGLAEAHDLFGDILSRHRAALALTEKAFATYAAQPKNSEEQALWDEFSQRWEDFKSADETQTQICQSLIAASAWEDVHIRFLDLLANTPSWAGSIHAMGEPLEKLVKLGVAQAEAAQRDGETFIGTAKKLIVSLFAVAIVSLCLFAMLIVRSVVLPLQSLRSTIEQVGTSNNFALRAQEGGRDEVGQAASAFNLLLERVQGALVKVMGGAGKIDQAASQTSAMAQRVASSATLQNEAAAAIASAIEHMSAAIAQISSSTQDARARAQDAATAADSGATAIQRTSQENDQVVREVNKASDTISALGTESNRISTIVKVIREVAQQTNLLALNAAIEAARAGEQGRGFAVVADEVRQLAERTRSSADEIREMVGAMQASVKQAMDDMAGVASRTRESRALSENAAASMSDILTSASQVSEAIGEVSAALAEQDRSAQAISRRIEAVALMSEENCDTGNHAAEVSRALDGAAGSLRLAVDQFQV